MYKLAFPTGRDSATFRDKGTEIPSLSRDKGTTGQAPVLERPFPVSEHPVPVCPGTSRPLETTLCVFIYKKLYIFLET